MLCQITTQGHHLQKKKMRTFQSTQTQEINQGLINQINSLFYNITLLLYLNKGYIISYYKNT